jgi:hypothetical protein
VFIGYLSSFFIALLLSLFYLSYAASGIFEQIKKEIKDEIKKEIIEESYKVSVDDFFVFDYCADISAPIKHFVFSEFAVDISVVDNDDIAVQKICLSEYFLRPPPNKL